MRAQASEDREIRDAIQEKIVDGLEYVRVKEDIAQTKARVNKLLYDSDDSCPSDRNPDKQDEKKEKEVAQPTEGDTEENSQKIFERHMENEKRIRSVIR